MLSQVGVKGYRNFLFEDIIAHYNEGSEVEQQYTFITTKNWSKHKRLTTKRWVIIVQCKDSI